MMEKENQNKNNNQDEDDISKRTFIRIKRREPLQSATAQDASQNNEEKSPGNFKMTMPFN